MLASQVYKNLESLKLLKDNWDGEGAEAPNAVAINNATRTIQQLLINNFTVVEIDSDVLGGVAIIILNPSGESAWISCMNNGEESITPLHR